jgi:hypothetical protein
MLARRPGLNQVRLRAVGRRKFIVLFTCAALCILTLSEASTVYAAGTTSRGAGVAAPFEGFTSGWGGPAPIGGAIGVDLVLGSTGDPYLPCQNYNPDRHSGDVFVNACEVRGSYTTYTRFPAGAGLLFPHGYFMGNIQLNQVQGGTLTTGWGQRAAGLSFEFYPDPRHDAEYVHSRFHVDVFEHRANGWTYSADVGRIRLSTLADPGTIRIVGRLTDGGRAVGPGRVKILIFGGRSRSSTGYPISSFAVLTSDGGPGWTSGPLYAGPQRITVTDNATGRECVLETGWLSGPDSALDIDLARPGFGHAGSVCQRH